MKRTALISFCSGIVSMILSVISFIPMTYINGSNVPYRSSVNTILGVFGLLLATISVILACTVAFNSKSKKFGRTAVVVGVLAFILSLSSVVVIMSTPNLSVNDSAIEMMAENAELREQAENQNGGI